MAEQSLVPFRAGFSVLLKFEARQENNIPPEQSGFGIVSDGFADTKIDQA
jgi:hypothetical protein